MHVAECTDDFDYQQLAQIFDCLDNEEQMDAFAEVVRGEFDYCVNSDDELYDKTLCGSDSFFKYCSDISQTLEMLKTKTLKRKSIKEKYSVNSPVLLGVKNPMPIVTPDDWINTSQTVAKSIANFGQQIEQWHNQIQTLSESGIHQLSLLKDYSLTTLMKQYEELNAQYKALEEDHKKYVSWYEDWVALSKEVTTEMKYPDEVQLNLEVIDPTFLRYVVGEILKSNNKAEELKKENDRLRKEQAAWSVRPEYKAEKARRESKTKKMISVEQIRKGLLRQADEFKDISDLSNFTLRVNKMLRHTAWDEQAESIEEELKQKHKANQADQFNRNTRDLQNSLNDIAAKPGIGQVIMEQNNTLQQSDAVAQRAIDCGSNDINGAIGLLQAQN